MSRMRRTKRQRPWFAIALRAALQKATHQPVTVPHVCPVCSGDGEIDVILSNAPNGENAKE